MAGGQAADTEHPFPRTMRHEVVHNDSRLRQVCLNQLLVPAIGGREKCPRRLENRLQRDAIAQFVRETNTITILAST